MKRACGCHADPIVFGHTECELGPPWIVRRIIRLATGRKSVVISDRRDERKITP